MTSFIMVYVTTSSKAEAEKIAQTLLRERLIACANIVGPVWSHFHWNEKIDSAEEYLMIMKTCADLFSVLEGRVRGLHSYEVPEIVAVPVVDGSKGYLDWMSKVLQH
ncbi:MAG: divalent-cation tolerance protein CutA [Candidatus Bathyarchaeia archaeon]